MYMLLHCGAQCSIISPSIPSALIEERVPRNRAGRNLAREKKKERERKSVGTVVKGDKEGEEEGKREEREKRNGRGEKKKAPRGCR